jgi:hypothetical protein
MMTWPGLASALRPSRAPRSRDIARRPTPIEKPPSRPAQPRSAAWTPPTGANHDAPRARSTGHPGSRRPEGRDGHENRLDLPPPCRCRQAPSASYALPETAFGGSVDKLGRGCSGATHRNTVRPQRGPAGDSVGWRRFDALSRLRPKVARDVAHRERALAEKEESDAARRSRGKPASTAGAA